MQDIIKQDDDILQTIRKAMEDTKADDIVILSLKELGAFTDYMVVAGATSDRQVKAIADRIEQELKKKFNRRPLGVEGTQLGQWVLIDYGDIVCHVFLNEIRDFYRLEDMWHDADRLSHEKSVITQPKKKEKTEPKKKVAPKKAVKAPAKKPAPKKSKAPASKTKLKVKAPTKKPAKKASKK